MHMYMYECICLSIYLPIDLSIYLCDMNAYFKISRPKLLCHFVQSNGVIDSFITRQGWIPVGGSKVMIMVTSYFRVLYVQIF